MTSYRMMTSTAFAAAFLTAVATMLSARAQMGASGAAVVTDGPQNDLGDVSGFRSARQNVSDSKHYEMALHTNNGFHANRISKECGPVTDPQLHTECVASFRE